MCTLTPVPVPPDDDIVVLILSTVLQLIEGLNRGYEEA